MKQKGFVYALYINGTFIEHFDTVDSAKECAKDSSISGDNAVFIKPIVYFAHKSSVKEAAK